MSTRPHTPGPWKLDRSGVNVVDPSERAEYVIAFCKGASIGELQANARLIASAPELLAALKDVTRLLELLNRVGANDPIESAVFKAREAIAKAEKAVAK